MKAALCAASVCVLLTGPVAQGGELAADGGFEKDVEGMAGPDGEFWGRFASAEPMGLLIVSDPLRKTNQVLRMEAHDDVGAYQGLFQAIPVKENKTYLVTAKALGDSAAPLGAGSTGLLSVEWRDDDGNEVGREDGPPWRGISAQRWETMEFETTAPAGATKAHFVILQRNPENAAGATGGAVLVDDFSVVEK